jgi:hypothetical protein
MLTLLGLSELGQINCITFGTPPVTTLPIPQLNNDSVFLSIINEGDPVPLAQKPYLELLLSVLILPMESLNEIYREGVGIPNPEFRISGRCIVLQDKDETDVAEESVQANEFPPEDIEGALFGNILLHMMVEYDDRIQKLAKPLRPADSG